MKKRSAVVRKSRMLDIHSLAAQIKQNCNISDAKYWGLYSPCGLLIRLRDLYGSEKGLKPWEKTDAENIRSWIGDRETLWSELESLDFQGIEVAGRTYRPFDTKGINAVLLEKGYLYGAGYGHLLKPTFLLAELADTLRRGRYTIFICGREIAHDLSVSPAVLQGNTIIARRQTMECFLWGRFQDVRSRKYGGALARAFSAYGISAESESAPEELEGAFSSIVEEELTAYIYHELGEASQRRVLGRWWKELVAALPYSRAQLFVRSLKDVLSDTCATGMLAHIIREQKTASLGFYVALVGDFRRIIFPEIMVAYDEFAATGSWDLIEKARAEGYRNARSLAGVLKEIVSEGRGSAEEIEKRLLLPLMKRKGPL